MTARIRLLIVLCRPPVFLLLALYTAVGLAGVTGAETSMTLAELLTAPGFPADSAMRTARTSPGGTPLSCAAPATSELREAGSSECAAYGR